MRYYTTLKIDDINVVNWDWFFEDQNTVRWNNSNTRFIVSFNEEWCDEMFRFNGLNPMTQEEAHALVNQEEWLSADPSL